MSAGYEIERRLADGTSLSPGVVDKPITGWWFGVGTPPGVRSATVFGSGMNFGIDGGQMFAIQMLGAVSGTSPTLNGKLQESDDNSSWSDIAGATFTQEITSNRLQIINFTRTKQYIRYVGTIAGTSPSFMLAVSVGKAVAPFVYVDESPTPSYNDATVIEGRTYQYRVRAKDEDGNTTEYSETVEIWAAGPTALTLDSANEYGGVAHTFVTLVWEAIPGATAYEVQRDEGLGFGAIHYVIVNPGVGDELYALDDQDGEGLNQIVSYQYRVRGVDGFGNYGEWSNTVNASAPREL